MRKQKKIRWGWGWLVWLALLMVVGLGIIFRKGKQATVNEITPETPSIEKKVLVLNFDPILENYGGVRLHEYFHWNDPVDLEQEYVDTVKEVSHGYVNYRVVERQDIDAFPVKKSDFQYNDDIYVSCINQLNACYPGTPYPECLEKIPECNTERVDFNALLDQYQVCQKVNLGEIDELWLWGGPHFRYYEANMAGVGAYWTNGPVITGTSCNRQLHVMGYNFERTASEMIENLAHRVEGTMKYVFGSWTWGNNSHDWNRFTLFDKVLNGKAVCGNVHYPPNGTSDYDWSNTTLVSSSCDSWQGYPELTGKSENVNCETWGCGWASRMGYKKWWLSHLPHSTGNTDGKLNNWWRYIVDYENAVLVKNENPNYVRLTSGAQDKYLACTINYTDKSIYLGVSQCSANIPYKAEIEFSNIQIPTNSQISKASLSFVQEGPYNNPLKLSIQLRYGKYLTRAIPWQIDGEWQSNTRGTTPDFGPLLQEIVRLKTWVKGGRISVVITYQAGSGYRSINAFEKDGPALASMLVYELSSTPSTSSSPAASPIPSISPSPSPSTSVSPSPTASASPRTGPGDYNGDGCVTLKDYQLVMANMGNPYTTADLQLIKANFGKCY